MTCLTPPSSVPLCGRRSPPHTGCVGEDPLVLQTQLVLMGGSEQYDQVCGRIIGYQIGSPTSFSGSSLSINNVYVDGISVTHGSPRQHIWTFAAGVDEQITRSCCTCPCTAGSTNESNIPTFVGQNYFCETGLTRWNGNSGVFWLDGDPLWDGQGCGPTSTCCTFNSPLWFNARLSSPTTLGALMKAIFPHLWDRTTSVRQA